MSEQMDNSQLTEKSQTTTSSEISWSSRLGLPDSMAHALLGELIARCLSVDDDVSRQLKYLFRTNIEKYAVNSHPCDWLMPQSRKTKNQDKLESQLHPLWKGIRNTMKVLEVQCTSDWMTYQITTDNIDILDVPFWHPTWGIDQFESHFALHSTRIITFRDVLWWHPATETLTAPDNACVRSAIRSMPGFTQQLLNTNTSYFCRFRLAMNEIHRHWRIYFERLPEGIKQRIDEAQTHLRLKERETRQRLNTELAQYWRGRGIHDPNKDASIRRAYWRKHGVCKVYNINMARTARPANDKGTFILAKNSIPWDKLTIIGQLPTLYSVKAAMEFQSREIVKTTKDSSLVVAAECEATLSSSETAEHGNLKRNFDTLIASDFQEDVVELSETGIA